MQDPWLKKYSNSAGGSGKTMVSSVKSREELLELMPLTTLENMLSFRTQMTFQKAVLAYIVSQELSKPEEQKLKEAFEAIDSDKNGVITKDEIMNAYVVVYGDQEAAQLVADRIMVRLDINQNGNIDYNGTPLRHYVLCRVPHGQSRCQRSTHRGSSQKSLQLL